MGWLSILKFFVFHFLGCYEMGGFGRWWYRFGQLQAVDLQSVEPAIRAGAYSTHSLTLSFFVFCFCFVFWTTHSWLRLDIVVFFFFFFFLKEKLVKVPFFSKKSVETNLTVEKGDWNVWIVWLACIFIFIFWRLSFLKGT